MALVLCQLLHHVKRDVIHSGYLKIDPTDYGQPLSITDFDKIWNSLQQIRQLYEDAANERCAVLFTVEK